MAMAESEVSTTPPTFARRTMRGLMWFNGATIVAEGYRNVSEKWDMLGVDSFLGKSIGNIAPTEALTAVVDVGEEFAIHRWGWSEARARLSGLAVIAFANFAVEAPWLFYNVFNAGDDNPEFATDMGGAALGYALMKVPLLALRYMDRMRARQANTET